MFFKTTLAKHIHVNPTNFHEELPMIVQHQLCKEVEGSIDEEHGYVVAVDTSSKDGIQIGPGVLLDSGPCSFHVKYTAIVLRPFVDEVVDTVVIKVLKIGLICELGPLEVFVSYQSAMPSDYRYDDTHASRPKFVAEQDDTITVGDQIRLQIRGVKISNTEIKVMGDINLDCMGKISA
eukprot:TRINITY_DN4610_c1_g1_i1.p1 TRINITY_DN4610_c1_g1~~TRINITY_DN4610_c1_g1_i1.p1  ORF type:complete len:178 (+),score=23.24 TRINITY_DN4610_c1_g1_i1:85-618(+)